MNLQLFGLLFRPVPLIGQGGEIVIERRVLSFKLIGRKGPLQDILDQVIFVDRFRVEFFLDADVEHLGGGLVPEGAPAASQFLHQVEGGITCLPVDELDQDLAFGSGQLLQFGRKLFLNIALHDFGVLFPLPPGIYLPQAAVELQQAFGGQFRIRIDLEGLAPEDVVPELVFIRIKAEFAENIDYIKLYGAAVNGVPFQDDHFLLGRIEGLFGELGNQLQREQPQRQKVTVSPHGSQDRKAVPKLVIKPVGNY